MHFCVFDYARSIFVQHASIVLQCNPDVIFPSVILCWINLSWVLSPIKSLRLWIFLQTSNYIFILDLTPDVNGFGKDNWKRRRESFKFWDLVRYILEILRMWQCSALNHHLRTDSDLIDYDHVFTSLQNELKLSHVIPALPLLSSLL